MWNPFRKSKVQKFKEAIVDATINYFQEKIDEEYSKLLANKNVNGLKLYQSLLTNADIILFDEFDNDIIGFFNKDYKYNINRLTNENGDKEYEFIIEGKFFINPGYDFDNTPLYPKVIFRTIKDKISCYGKIVYWCIEQTDINYEISIKIPYDETNIINIYGDKNT